MIKKINELSGKNRFRYLPEHTDYVVVDKDFFSCDLVMPLSSMIQNNSSSSLQPSWMNSEYLT